MSNSYKNLLITRLSPAARAEYDRAWIDANARIIDASELDRRQAAALGCTCYTNMEDEECDCPAYTLDTWAMDAIEGKRYRRRSGPDVRWAMLLPSGHVLEVRPRYLTTEEDRAHHAALGLDRMGEYEPLSNCNWQHSRGFELAIYRTPHDRYPCHRGWFDGYGDSLFTDGPQALTDEVAHKLWAIHRDRSTAFVGMPWCGNCRRPLTDEVSVKLGLGPSCANQMGIPHSLPIARVVEIHQEGAR